MKQLKAASLTKELPKDFDGLLTGCISDSYKKAMLCIRMFNNKGQREIQITNNNKIVHLVFFYTR